MPLNLDSLRRRPDNKGAAKVWELRRRGGGRGEVGEAVVSS